MLRCGACEDGWNKAGLVALLRGIANTPENYAHIKRECAKRVYGYHYEAAQAERLTESRRTRSGRTAEVRVTSVWVPFDLCFLVP